MKSVLRAELAAVTTIIAFPNYIKGPNNIKNEGKLDYIIKV